MSLLASLAVSLMTMLEGEVSAGSNTYNIENSDCGTVEIPQEYIGSDTPDVFIVGEWHGTNEGPKAIENLACHFARNGQRVVVLLEMPSRFDGIIGSLGEPELAQQELCFQMPDFWGFAADGRRSVAIADLILRINQLKQIFGERVQIGAISSGHHVPRPAGMGTFAWMHNHMAENIIRYAGDYDVVLVNIGNAHPSPLRRTIQALPQGAFLDVSNVIQIREEGFGWNCQNGLCASHRSEFSWRYPPDRSLTEFPVLRLVEGIDGYEVALFIGPITASEPVADSDFCTQYSTESRP